MSGVILLSSAQMRRIEPLFPGARGLPRVDDRKVISGLAYVIRHGLQWKDAPVYFGPPKTLYNRFIHDRDAAVAPHDRQGYRESPAFRRSKIDAL